MLCGKRSFYFASSLISSFRKSLKFYGSALLSILAQSALCATIEVSVAAGDYRMVVVTTAAGKSIYDQSYWLGFDEITFSFVN